jgi:fatty acid desaturase
MITAFWVLFIAALLVLAVCLFFYLLIPIVIVGLLVLAFNACGGSHGRGVVETTHSNSAEHTNYHRSNGRQV